MSSNEVLSALAVRILDVTHCAPGKFSAEYRFHNPGKYSSLIACALGVATGGFVYYVVEERGGIENHRVAQWTLVGLGLYCLCSLALSVSCLMESKVRATLVVQDGMCRIRAKRRGIEAEKEWLFDPDHTQIRLWIENQASYRFVVVGLLFSDFPWRIRLLRSTNPDECAALADRLQQALNVPVLGTFDD